MYFFQERTAAILAHGIVKEGKVPPTEIDRAIGRKVKFERSPDHHTHQGEVGPYGDE